MIIINHIPVLHECGKAYLNSQTAISKALIMNILIVNAHPEPRSLTSSLKDSAVAALRDMGHVVVVTDLYAEGWKALVDRDDFPALAPDQRLQPVLASRDAFAGQSQTADVAREQERL